MPQRAARALCSQTIVGESETLREAWLLATQVASRRLTTVLLIGETGTGKELFARGIHVAGEGPSTPFVAINCAAIPESLLESELFGHEAGAFTDARAQKRGLFELAGGGTLFLDEVAELPSRLQPKLLRVLEERSFRRVGGLVEMPVDCRVIAGTNLDLEQAMLDGRFREDLFYRLNVFRIDLPPLRARIRDIESLAHHFLDEIAHDQRDTPKRLDPGALTALRAHPWPGNVRQLRNVLERAAIVCGPGPIRESHLGLDRRQSRLTPDGKRTVEETIGAIHIPPGGKSLEDIEREAIRLTMAHTRGNLSAAARILGISRPTLARKLRVNGLSRRSLLASS